MNESSNEEAVRQAARNEPGQPSGKAQELGIALGRLWRAIGFLRRAAVVAALVAAVSLCMEVVTEATLLSEVIRHTAARMFAPYNAYFYGKGPQVEAVSERLLVVNIGQATLDRLHSDGTLSYGQHARILERMRRARPQALFIDFQFQVRRHDPSISALMQSLCSYKADGIPVFMAAAPESSNGRLRPELEDLLDAQQRSCFEKVSVGYQAAGTDRIAWTYPLRSEVGGETLPSAALAMAQVMRGETLQVGDDRTVMGLDWASSSRHLGPSWRQPSLAGAALGAARAAGDAAAGQPEQPAGEPDPPRHYCRAPSFSDIIPLQAFLARLLLIKPDTRPTCPLHESVEASWLTAAKTPEQTTLLDDQLRARAVFYGGTFDSADFVTTPLHGALPGVYLHAQATDNLVRYGNAWRHPDIAGPFDTSSELPILALSFFIVALAFLLGRGLVSWGWRRLADSPIGNRIDRRLPVRRGGRIVRGWLRQAVQHATGSPIVDGPRLRMRAWRGSRAFLDSLLHAWQWFRALLGQLGAEFGGLATRLGRFYLSLAIVVPMSLVLEHVLHVSVIGYANVLVFCLMGEVFTSALSAEQALQPRPADSPSFPPTGC